MFVCIDIDFFLYHASLNVWKIFSSTKNFWKAAEMSPPLISMVSKKKAKL